MRVGDWEITAEEGRRLRNRALVSWCLSAETRPGGLAGVWCEICEHAGQPCVVVAGREGKVLAWFRLVRIGGRVALRRRSLDEVPSSVDVLARSAVLRGLSQTLLARCSALRSRSARVPGGRAAAGREEMTSVF